MHHRTEASTFDLRVMGILVVIGATLLVSSALIGFTGWTDTYRHDVRELDPASETHAQGGELLSTGDLTVAERAVLLDSITS